jgi:hypothetical protein
MTTEQQAKVCFVNASNIGSDFVRCPTCDAERTKAGSTDDVCVPFNSDADLLCGCGDVALPYDCQGQKFLLQYPDAAQHNTA